MGLDIDKIAHMALQESERMDCYNANTKRATFSRRELGDLVMACVQRIQREQKADSYQMRSHDELDGWSDWQHIDHQHHVVLVRDRLDYQIRPLFTFPPATPSAVPDGWQLVPKEPTPEMCEAFGREWNRPWASTMKSALTAMLSAAPAPAGDEIDTLQGHVRRVKFAPAGEKGEQ